MCRLDTIRKEMHMISYWWSSLTTMSRAKNQQETMSEHVAVSSSVSRLHVGTIFGCQRPGVVVSHHYGRVQILSHGFNKRPNGGPPMDAHQKWWESLTWKWVTSPIYSGMPSRNGDFELPGNRLPIHDEPLLTTIHCHPGLSQRSPQSLVPSVAASGLYQRWTQSMAWPSNRDLRRMLVSDVPWCW